MSRITQDTTKKTRRHDSLDDKFSNMLDETKQTILFSDTLKESVENLLHEEAAAELFKCKICLDPTEINCNLTSLDTRAQSITIKAELSRSEARLILNDVDSIRKLEIDHGKNLLASHDIHRIKLSKKKSPDKFLLKVKLLKS